MPQDSSTRDMIAALGSNLGPESPDLVAAIEERHARVEGAQELGGAFAAFSRSSKMRTCNGEPWVTSACTLLK